MAKVGETIGYEEYRKDRQKVWDQRFVGLAKFWAQNSKDPSTKTGAVLVSPDRRDVILGYNGFPSQIADDYRLTVREEKYELIVHCEMNAVLNAKRDVAGYTLYTWPFLSCTRCAVHMLAAGITRFVAPKIPDELKERWEASLNKTKEIFEEAGVEVVEI
jgi:dCMP deaminase